MRLYRGCMWLFFVLVIGLFSFYLSHSFGLLGLLLPPALFTLCFKFIDALLGEILLWCLYRNR